MISDGRHDQGHPKPPAYDWAAGPQPVDDVDLAFPARGVTLCPQLSEVPKAITLHSPWANLAWAMWGNDAVDVGMMPKPDIDPEVADRHIKVILGCMGISAEQKMQGAGWLMSLWFEAAAWRMKRSERDFTAGDPEVAAEIIALRDAS